MTEQEYIETHVLFNIRAAKTFLYDLFPINEEVISVSELKDILKRLSSWETKLVEKIKTEP